MNPQLQFNWLRKRKQTTELISPRSIKETENKQTDRKSKLTSSKKSCSTLRSARWPDRWFSGPGNVQSAARGNPPTLGVTRGRSRFQFRFHLRYRCRPLCRSYRPYPRADVPRNSVFDGWRNSFFFFSLSRSLQDDLLALLFSTWDGSDRLVLCNLWFTILHWHTFTRLRLQQEIWLYRITITAADMLFYKHNTEIHWSSELIFYSGCTSTESMESHGTESIARVANLLDDNNDN